MDNDIVNQIRIELNEYIQSLYVYKFLSKHDKKDLIEYLNNSNYIHHEAVKFNLQHAEPHEHIDILKKYIKNVFEKRYIKKYSIFFEQYQQNYLNEIQAKPNRCGLNLTYEYSGFYVEGVNIAFLTETCQYLIFFKKDFTDDLWKQLNNINSWKKFIFKAKFNYSDESPYIQVGELIDIKNIFLEL